MCNYNYKHVASDYDQLLTEYEWKAPALIYDYLSQYILEDTKMLDIGVGTGISSQRFHQLGVDLYGLDNSPDMLVVCEAKSVFKELLLCDILKDQIPYSDTTFEYVVSSGVLHFFSDLGHIFAEVSRVLKHDGLFAFTYIKNLGDEHPFASVAIDGADIYHHSKTYLKVLASRFKMTLLGEQSFKTLKDLTTRETLVHHLMVLRKR